MYQDETTVQKYFDNKNVHRINQAFITFNKINYNYILANPRLHKLHDVINKIERPLIKSNICTDPQNQNLTKRTTDVRHVAATVGVNFQGNSP